MNIIKAGGRVGTPESAPVGGLPSSTPPGISHVASRPDADTYDELPIKFSVVANVNARTPIVQRQGTWGVLTERLAEPNERPSKEACPLLKLVTFGDKRNAEGSLRHNGNVLEVFGLTGDYDAETITVNEAAERLEAAGVEALIYTTASHRPGAPRWRVLAPLSTPHAPEAYDELVDKLNGALGGILAGESWTLSQVFYHGRVQGAQYESRRTHGECIDRLNIQPIGKSARAKARQKATAPDDLDRAVAISNFSDKTRDELRSALPVIPSDEREVWVRIGQALKRLGDIGYALWIEWSSKSCKFDADDAERVWESLSGDRSDYRAVFAEAQRHGWKNPRSGAQMKESAPDSAFKPAPRSAAHLIAREFKPVMFVIANLLPEGVFLLAASPKVGKSWLALQFGIGVASGGSVLGEQAETGEVLALMLEDNDRRLKSRLVQLNADLLPDAALARLHFETEWPRVDAGGAELIGQWLTEHPEARLVIVDVLERIRPARDANANAYGEDYQALQALKAIAERHRVAIIVVHHTRKAASDDAMQLVSGTQGLTGAADGVLVLARARGEARGELTIMARDLEREGAFAVEFVDGQWSMIGPAGAIAKTALQQSIIEVLEMADAPMTQSAIARSVGRVRQTVAQALRVMVREGLVHLTDGRYHVNTTDTTASLSCVASTSSTASTAGRDVVGAVGSSGSGGIPDVSTPSVASDPNDASDLV